MIESPEEFVRLRTSDEQAEYTRAAHEAAPLHVWQALVDEHPDMRVWVAHNKTVPLEILAQLAEDAAPEVRAMVAMKRKLSPALQQRLATDPDEAVRGRLVRNARVLSSVLEMLARGTDEVATEAREVLRRRQGAAG
jgi:hypothetical protein